MNIRKATPKDVPLISRIHARSWKYAFKGHLPQSYLDNLKEDFWEPTFKKWLEEGTVTVRLLSIHGQMAGCISYGRAQDEKHPDWGEIRSLYLLPEYMGCGFGKHLLKTGMDDLRKRGYKTIYLWVLDTNTHARHFYEKNGFRKTEDLLIVELGGKQLTDIRYIYP